MKDYSQAIAANIESANRYWRMRNYKDARISLEQAVALGADVERVRAMLELARILEKATAGELSEHFTVRVGVNE